MGVKWDPVEHAWVPDDFLNTYGNRRVPNWRKDSPLSWDVNSQPRSVPKGWGDTIEDLASYKEAQVGPDRYGPRLLQKFRFRDAQHEADRQDALWQKITDAKITGRFRIASDGPIRLGSQDTYKHFRGISQAELSQGPFTRPVVVTDIETGNNDQVISVAAIKGVMDKRTGEFRVLDTYERYYTPEKTYSQSFNMAREVHKLTPEKIAALRNLQRATYNEKYDQREAKDLLNFMHGSLVVGHNVEEFDFSRLGIASQLQAEDVLDTLVWAQNIGIPKGKRGLEPLLKRFTGRDFKRWGLSHHFGFHDILANTKLFASAWMQRGNIGRDVRWVTANRGLSYGAYESAAGTAIIKGGYYMGRGPRGLEYYMNEDDFDEETMFSKGYDKYGNMVGLDGQYDENGKKVLPDGFSYGDDIPQSLDELGVNPYSTLSLDIRDTMAGLQSEMSRVRNTMSGYREAQKLGMHRYLAGMDEDSARDYLKGLKYNDDAIASMMREIAPLRIARERKEEYREFMLRSKESERVEDMLGHMFRKGELSEQDYRWLSDVNEAGDIFTPREIMYRAREKRDEMMTGIKKERLLDRAERRKQITAGQRETLSLIDSYSDLVDAMDDVIDKNNELLKIYQAIGNIKPYDINQLVGAAKGQWAGIIGASKGVVPNFIRNPVSRLGEAAFNAVDYRLSPWNAFNRVWNSGIGTAITGGLTAGFGPAGMAAGMAITGGVNAVTQIAGNYQQAKIERFGLNLQNNLNTLGAMISWISTPFQLLHKAIKLVTGAFGGLTLKLNNIMGTGIESMSQLGNPLEQLTGVNYTDYQELSLIDMASLLKGGSTNASIEAMAKRQRDLYRYGKVDTEHMIAANMLGVFGEAYTPTTDTQGAYYNMANKILHDMMGQNEDQRANTMYYVTKLDENLAQTIRTALMLGASDIRDMANPNLTGNAMYWRPFDKEGREEAQFRRTQFEYGVATQQFGFTKMRFADRLWNGIGRDLYNGFNRLLDSAAAGDWKGILEEASNMWELLKTKVKGVWEGLNKDGDLSAGFSKGLAKIKEWGWDIAIGIIDIWNQIFRVILEKSQGLIAYLSTIQVGFDFKDGKLVPHIETIGDAETLKGYKHFASYHNAQGMDLLTATAGNQGYLDLAELLYPDYSKKQLASLTVDDLRERLANWDRVAPGEWKDGVLKRKAINLPQYGITDIDTSDPKQIESLLWLLAAANTEGAGYRKEAALLKSGIPREYWAADPYGKMGILPAYDELTSATMDALLTAKGIATSDNGASFDINLNFGDKNLGKITYENGKTRYEGIAPLSTVTIDKNVTLSVDRKD